MPRRPLDTEEGLAERLRPATLKGLENGYGRWLTWLDSAGRLDPGLEPGERVDRDVVAQYLDMLEGLGNAATTVAGRMWQLGAAMRAMNQPGDWAWLTRAAARTRAEAGPSASMLERMRPAEEVVQLGLDMITAANNDRFRTETDRATLEATDFAAFRPLADLPMAMTAHVVFTALDALAPATTSATLVAEVIRNWIGFGGLLMSDDISMGALSGSIAAWSSFCS